MRNIFGISIVILLVGIFCLACSTNSVGEHYDHLDHHELLENEDAEKNQNEVDEKDSTSNEEVIEPEPEPYSLEIAVERVGDEYVLTFETDLILSKENYEGDHVEGEGHIHYFRNNRLVGPITDNEPLVLERLQEGENVIRLDLAKNDHTSYRVSREVRFINELE